MATTDAHGHGGLALAGSATTAFVPGVGQVDSDIIVEWDFGLGLEDVTSYLYEAESLTGRDWPSQLQGKAGPGRGSFRFRNDDDRFSYFNTASPLNAGGRSLDPGRLMRIRTSDATDIDPIVLARDRFDGDGIITLDELGATWEHQTPAALWARVDGNAVAPTAGAESLMILDTGVVDYYVQATIAEGGDHVDPVAGLQEGNELRLVYRWQDSSNYSYLAFYQFSSGGTGTQQNGIEGFDVVAGTPSSIFGPVAEVTSGSADAQGDHLRRITIGVHVVGAAADFYVNGARRTTISETALQTDETHVGLYAYYGVGNRAPAFDEFAVWDRFCSETDGVIWTGNVVDVFPEAAPGAPKTVTVTAEGSLAQLGAPTIQPQPWAGRMATGVAIGEAAQRAGLLYPPGLLDRGDITAGSSTDSEINALTHCRKLEEVEAGFLHEAPEGWLVFRDRTYRDGLTVAATFSDAPGAQFGYHEFELLQWRRELINRVTAGVSYGSPDVPVAGGFGAAGTASGVARNITWTFPGSVNDGDLFVLFITSTIADDDEGWLVPIFWVRERDTGASSSKRTQVYTHIAGAAEASSTVTFYNDSAAAGGSFITGYYQIRNWYGTHEGIHVGPWTGDPGTGANPEPLLPPWGDTNPSVFLAQRSGTNLAGAGSITDPTYPLGYVNTNSHFQNGAANIHDCGMQIAWKAAMAALEDPSTFSGFAGLQNAETNVVAVRGRNGDPPEPRGRLRVTVEDVPSQRNHNTVASYDGCDLFPDEDTAEAWCDLMLARYSSLRPIVRFSFTATATSAYRAQAFRRRLGDRIRVTASNGVGMGIGADFHIESIRHRWSNAGKLWVTTWELSPA